MDLNVTERMFFTGATGFLGHYVLRELLDRRRPIVAMLRPPLEESARRLEAMLREIGLEMAPCRESGQLLLVEGTLPDGLPEPTWGSTASIFHCAASLQLFSNGTGDPFATNLRGTEAVLAWARRENVRQLHAVSTAYTCGWNTGLIPERFHEGPPEFQTDYERSKWESEARLREWAAEAGHMLTLYRPSFLVGDSETGHTTQFGGFYQFARLICVLKEQYRDSSNGEKTYIPLRVPGRPEDTQNIIPVDFVARIIAEVVDRPEFHGRIYHLTNPEPPTNDMMKRCYEDYFGLYGGSFADPDEVLGNCSAAESFLWDQYHLLTPRVVHNPRFDVSNMRRIMEVAGVTFPRVDPRRVFKLFDYAARRDWGRQTDGFHG